MNCRTCALAFLSFIFVAVPRANGQSYVGKVLYPLTEPSGSAGLDLFIQPDTASIGQTVGNGTFSEASHALLWTSAGAVDLNPTILGGISYLVNWPRGKRKPGLKWETQGYRDWLPKMTPYSGLELRPARLI